MIVQRVTSELSASFEKYRPTQVSLLLLLLISPSRAAVISGPTVSPSNGHTYYLLEVTSWSAAEAEAQSLGGHLATVGSLAENQWIYDTFADPGGDGRNLWIGYNDEATEGSFTWSSGETVPFTNWSLGEPNNLSIDGDPQDYVHIWGNFDDIALMPAVRVAGTWNDHTDLGIDATTSGNYGVVEVVPEPGAVWLIAVASVTGLKRKRRRQFGVTDSSRASRQSADGSRQA